MKSKINLVLLVLDLTIKRRKLERENKKPYSYSTFASVINIDKTRLIQIMKLLEEPTKKELNKICKFLNEKPETYELT